MARTANRYLKLNTIQEKTVKVYYAGNYLRLSLDSDYTGSDSLENQRKLAREYLNHDQSLTIVKEYVDDGRSGTNFERPSFSRMIADLKQGVINCIIVKDLSRFGREHIEAGNYIEKVFPFLRTRFISIADSYDSINSECNRKLLLISLKNLMHEMYARDISKKTGSTFQIRQEKEMFYRSATIPYGYKMNSDNKNYCIDEVPAAIVKELFMQYSGDISRYTISKWLYENHILTPMQYRQLGRAYQAIGDPLKTWESSTIERILKNSVYIGTVLRHKTEQSFFYDKSSTVVPESEQVTILNNHPPIVSEDIFSRVQKKLHLVNRKYQAQRKDSAFIKSNALFDKNVFSEKIFCGNCKTSMARTVSYHKVNGETERIKTFKCRTHMANPSCCDSRRIKENMLCDILFATIQKHLYLLKGVKQQIDNDVNLSFAESLQNLEKERQLLQNCQSLLEQDYIQAYTRYTNGTNTVSSISENQLPADNLRDEFQKFRILYNQKELTLKSQLTKLCEKKRQIKKHQTAIKEMLHEWLKLAKETVLTEQMIEICVERIELFQDNQLSIKLRYQDSFMLIDSWLNKRGVG